MNTLNAVSDVSARCRLSIKEAISLHKNGVPKNELSKELMHPFSSTT